VKKETDTVSSIDAVSSVEAVSSVDAAASVDAEPQTETPAETPAADAAETKTASVQKASVQSVVERAPAPDVDPDYEYAISVQDVHITYRSIIDPRANTLRHTLTQLGRKGNSGRKVKLIHAVRGISLDVPHGSILGIIGANGAGKSTLMRAMAGILPPTSGQIVVNGRISTLLALGVGFNGQLSGRDNVILGGLAAGLTRKQVNERFKDIADWAELDEFIDMPMKSYSSGMYGRLAFAVSTHLEPDVLLIDEALSTGDAHFRRKSYDKMQELVGQARTIVIVSHGIGAIREMCDDCIWIHKGEIVRHGAPDEVSAEYLEFQGVPPEPKKDDTIDAAAEFDDAMVMEDV
jgi:ABC-type polysaccharide/polyol phosphate transport system ATPase subunit